MLAEMGLAGFTEQARRELAVAGETTSADPAGARPAGLTAQAALIARLSRDGLSNQ